MKIHSLKRTLLLLTTCILSLPATAHEKLAVDKVRGDLSAIVLGSGGPVATASGRASAGYLVFVDGKPRILLDAGGGTYQRLAASGADVKDLDLVLLTHLHVDHTGDLSSIIKTVYFHNTRAGTFRTAPIHIWGPAANGIPFPKTKIAQYPSTTDYVNTYYAMPNGVERYLNIFTRAIRAGIFNYKVHDVSSTWKGAETELVYEKDGLRITTIAVNHGPVPAVAYRIDYKGKSLVYSGDTSSVSNNMVTLANGADMLIYDTGIMDDAPANPVFFQLHTTPTRMGQVAAAAGVKKLILSHITPVTEPRLREVKSLVRAQGFYGRIKAANDLKVLNIGAHHHEGRRDE